MHYTRYITDTNAPQSVVINKSSPSVVSSLNSIDNTCS